jgi:hypothetical protein
MKMIELLSGDVEIEYQVILMNIIVLNQEMIGLIHIQIQL